MGVVANADGSVTFNFGYSTDTESGVSHYKIYRKTGGTLDGCIGQVQHGGYTHSYVDGTTVHNTVYNYAVSAVDKRGNESSASAWSSNVTAQNTTPPGDVDHDSLAILAYPDYLQVSWEKVIGNKTSDVATSYVLERQVNGGSWSTIEVNTNTYNWLFNRTTDGYPEIDNAPEGELLLSVFKFRVKAKNIYGTVSTGYDSQTAGVAPTSTTNYGSWVPQTPTVYERTGNRTASVAWSGKIGTSSRKLNGFLRYDVQISKNNSDWYSPTTSLDPYASADNWKTGSLNGYYSVPVEAFTQSLPLEADVAGETVKDTTYYYRVRVVVQKASATYSSWQSVTVVAKATSALDVVTNAIKTAAIVDDAITTDKIYCTQLSSIINNLGVIEDGALTIADNSYNYWVLGDGIITGKTAGDFRIGNATNYLQFTASTGVMALSIQYFKIATLETSVLGVLKVSSAGTIDSLTKPFSIENAGAGTTLLKVNGTTALSLYDTGNVGALSCIGKINATLTTEQLRLGYDVNNYTTFTVGSTGSLTIAATGTNPNITLTPGGTGYTILNGNVGIGTTNPTYKLSVAGDSAILGTVSSNSNTGFPATGLLLQSSSGSNGYYSPSLKFDVGGGGGQASIGTIRETGAGGNLVFHTDTTGGVSTERMRITSAGNVGIGTTSPGVVKDSSLVASLQIGDGSAVSRYMSIKGGVDSEAMYSVENDARQYRFGISVDDKFYIYDDTANLSRLIIDTSGSVGIGVAPDSSYSLKTSGDVHFGGKLSFSSHPIVFHDFASGSYSVIDGWIRVYIGSGTYRIPCYGR